MEVFKMKKIFSLILVVALTLSCFATISFAEVNTTTPALLTATLDPTDPDEQGFDKYSLKIYVENAPFDVTYTSSFGGKYTGTTLNGMDLGLTITPTVGGNAATVYEDYVVMVNESISSLTEAPYGISLSAATNAPLPAVTGKSFALGDKVLIGEVYIYTAQGKDVVVDIDWNTDVTCQLTVSKYEGSKTPTADQPDKYNISNGLLKLKDSTKDGFTIGETTPPVTTVDKGFIANYTTQKPNVTGVVFTITTDDESVTSAKTVKRTHWFNTAIERAGTAIQAGLKVTGVPEGVNLNVSAETTYDAKPQQ